MADAATDDKGNGAGDVAAPAWIDTAERALRRGAVWLGVAAGELAAILTGLAILVAFLANSLLTRQETDLELFRPTVKRMVAQSFNGTDARFESLNMQWFPSRDSLVFAASGITVTDDSGTVVQTVDALEAGLLINPAGGYRPDLRDVVVRGGEVTWTRSADGEILAGLGGPDVVGRIGPTYRGAGRTPPTEGADWTENFRSLQIADSRVNVIDEALGVASVIEVGELAAERSGDRITLDVDGAMLGEDGTEAGTFQLGLDADMAARAVDVAITLGDARLDRLVTETGRLSVLQAFALPVTGRLSGEYAATGGLQLADVALKAGSGFVQLGGEQRGVTNAAFEAALDPGEQTMDIARIALDASLLSFDGSGELREIGRISDGDVGTSPQFDVAFRRAAFDATPVLAAPLRVSDVRAVGTLDLDGRVLAFERLRFRPADFAIDLQGEIATAETGLRRLALSGATEGDMRPEDLLALWPPAFADGARRWIERAVLGGRVDRLTFDVDLDADFFAEPALTPERLDVAFGVTDGAVRYISTMTPLTGVVAQGRIQGNALSLDVARGAIGDVSIASGQVRIPQLMPKGGDILIEAEASGATQALLSLADEEPFGYLSRYGLQPDGFGGQGRMTLNVRRPLLEFFEPDRVEYAVDGVFNDASAPFRFGPFGITDADVTFRGGKDGLVLDGLANIGPWRASIGWSESLDGRGTPTEYRASGPMDQATLDAFGIGLRRFVGGTVSVEALARGTGTRVQTGTLDVDLAPAEITVGQLYTKPSGVAGSLTAQLARSDSGLRIDRLSVESEGLDIRGSAVVQDDFALNAVELDRVSVADVVEGSATLMRETADGRPRFAVRGSGQFIDLSSLTQRLTASDGPGITIPLVLRADFDRLVLAEDYALEDAVLSVTSDETAIRDLVLSGTRPDGPATASIVSRESGREASLRLPDGALALEAFYGMEGYRGGALSLDASLPEAGEAGATIGEIRVEDFKVGDAPFFAQLLSIASLTGLLDTLGGEGLSFDELEGQFSLRDRRLAVRDGRMSGPALGMTLEGDIDLGQGALDIEGALVPAYTANSLLSDIPLVGDIFTDKDGEGVFALTYTMEGPFERAQVAVNPLSALTPGFLRGIFRSDRGELPDAELAEQIEAVRPDDAD